jgi:hypothetical protein
MDPYFNSLITGADTIDEIKERIHTAGLEYKEDDNLMIVFSPTNKRTSINDNTTKSTIIDKSTLKPIATQFNNLIYNEDTENFLSDKDWNNVTIKYCYEGTMILVFYAHGKWYFCTRKCLDATKSSWIKGVSYYDLFMDAINGKFNIDELDKNYCYHFILIHYKNKNIVEYSELGKRYKNVALAMTTKLKTFERIDYHVKGTYDQIIYPETFLFSNLQEAKHHLEMISNRDKEREYVSSEGFIIEYYENNVLTLLKMQTPLYQYIANVKPNVSNLDALLLELYQKDKLRELAPFFTLQCREVVIRTHNAMKTISNEFLNIYHTTRSHKNESLYNELPSSYKCVLYAIHGIFIEKRKREQEQNKQSELGDRKSITIYDVYNYLKSMEPHYLRTVFVDRLSLLQNKQLSNLINVHCMDAYLQGMLMQ